MMKVEPSGIVMIGECSIRTSVCQALQPASITAVWASPGRVQINVCRPCLEEMIRNGEWEVEGARVPQKFDVAVYDSANRLQLVVEVKSRIPEVFHEDDAQWATQVHRNLVTHAAIPLSPYFLLVRYPEHFYLWKQDSHSNPMHSADYYYQDSDLLAPFSKSRDTVPPVHEDQQALVVTEWLKSLVKRTKPSQTKTGKWLTVSGLFKAIQHGEVVREAAVMLGNHREVVGTHG